MKKSIIALALLGMMGLNSCSDTFNPDVDFGDKTYINDYSKLVEAVNNLNSTLSERLNALNTLLEKGLYDIKVAIDENTGAIKLQTTALQDGLGTLNTTFLEGFSALNSTIQSNGDKIVTAINANGELIALHLDSNGELLSATIKSSTTEIIETLNNNSKALTDKLDALNTSLEAGLANLTVKVGEIGTQLAVTNNKFDDINSTLNNLDGSVKAQTEKIGELSKNVLDGFKNVEVQLTELNNGIGQLKVSIDAETTAIVNLNKDLTDSLKALQDGMERVGGQIVFAINEEGELIANAVDAQTKLIETKVFCNCYSPEEIVPEPEEAN